MSTLKSTTRGLVLAALVLIPTIVAQWSAARGAFAHDTPAPTASSPIAITHDDQFVWSVNPDAGSVSLFAVGGANAGQTNVKLAEVPVGTEPWCVAIASDDRKVYVTNMGSGTVSVIDAAERTVERTIPVGKEPFGCALTPDGRRLYVANQASDTVSVIDTHADRVVKTIENVGPRPHAVAITADGDRVFVTQFLAQPRAGDPRPATRTEGADDGREGRVTVIDGRNNHVIGSLALNPIADVGAAFRSDGNTLAREPLTGVFDNVSGAF